MHLFVLSYDNSLNPRTIQINAEIRDVVAEAADGAITASDIPLDSPLLDLRFVGSGSPPGPLSGRRPGIVSFSSVDMTRMPDDASPDTVALIAIIDPSNRPFDVAEISPRPGDSGAGGADPTISLDLVLRRPAYVAAYSLPRSV